MKQQYGFSMGVALAFVIALMSVTDEVPLNRTCNGSVDFSILYNDGRIVVVRMDGTYAIRDTERNTPPTELQRLLFSKAESFAGENGITIRNNKQHIQLVPGGRSGAYAVYLFDYKTGVWSNVGVYCQPLGLVYRRESDEIVGFCAVNTTYGPITCVPYFKLRIRNNRWMDVSSDGSCSQPLSTANITNPVILQADSDYGVDETRLYFAERGTNRLHEIILSQGESHYYELDMVYKIDHLIPVKNASFYGLRVVCRLGNSLSLYQRWFLWQLDSSQQQQTGFVGEFVVTEITESNAFDSYNLSYLVSFNSNRKAVIIKEDGHSKYYYTLPYALDEPIQCQNLVGPVTHHLICLARNGLSVLLINITNNATVIPVNKSREVIEIERLTENVFYLLDDQRELSVYLITSTVMCLGTYTVRPDTNFTIMSASSDISCSITENVNFDNSSTDDFNNLNTDKPHSIFVVVIILLGVTIAVTTVGIIAVVIIIINNKGAHCLKKKNCDSINGTAYSAILETNSMQSNHSDIDLKGRSIKDNNTTPTDSIVHPMPDYCDTGQRHGLDPPTISNEACQEVSGGQEGIIVTAVNSAVKEFPGLDLTRMQQNENRRDETQCVEEQSVPSAECLKPQECAEDILPQREDPVGETACQ